MLLNLVISNIYVRVSALQCASNFRGFLYSSYL